MAVPCVTLAGEGSFVVVDYETEFDIQFTIQRIDAMAVRCFERIQDSLEIGTCTDSTHRYSRQCDRIERAAPFQTTIQRTRLRSHFVHLVLISLSRSETSISCSWRWPVVIITLLWWQSLINFLIELDLFIDFWNSMLQSASSVELNVTRRLCFLFALLFHNSWFFNSHDRNGCRGQNIIRRSI